MVHDVDTLPSYHIPAVDPRDVVSWEINIF